MLNSSIHVIPIVATAMLSLLALKGYLRTNLRLPKTQPPVNQFKTYASLEVEFDGETADDTSESFVTDGLSAFACSKASGTMNFDFFGTKRSANGLVSFYLGDVSGKGLSAAMFQAACESSLKLASSITLDPVGIVSEVNDSLSQRGIEGRFATLLYGTLELSTGRLRLLSAGHPNPIRVSKSDQVEILECRPCLPVGILPEHKYVLTEHRLKPGDTLLLYTDGIVEARDVKKAFWGEVRLAEAAQRFHSPLPKHMVENVLKQVQDFGDKRRDDQTLLALHYSGLRSEFATNRLQPEGCLAYA